MSNAGFGIYHAKPVEVQAWRFNKLDEAGLSGLRKWAEDNGAGVYYWSKFPVQGGGFGLEIENADGQRFLVRDGEYVVKDPSGRLYASDPDEFLANFERQ